MTPSEVLSAPLTLPCGQRLPNRFVKAATSEGLANRADGAPTAALTRLYQRWADGGAGLLITGNAIVDRHGREAPGNVLLEDGHFLPELTAWADAVRASGAKLWLQINHAGRQTTRRIAGQSVAPSAVALEGFGSLFTTPRPLEHAEVEHLIARFAEVAALAERAGFDGVQIHAAHGYLISQFLSPRTNRRTDTWGGSAENRRRFLLEIVRATRARVAPEFAVGVKLNSADFQRGGFTEEESMAVVDALEAEGIDLLEISGGSYEQPAMMGSGGGAAEPDAPRASTRAREAYFLDYARGVRRRTKLPLLLTGGFRTAAAMAAAVDDGAVNAVGLARPVIVEPDLPARILAGTAGAARPVRVRVGVRLLDDMLQGVWYQRQLVRMGAGLAPKPDLGNWRALIAGFFANYMFNPLALIKRRPERLATAGPAREAKP